MRGGFKSAEDAGLVIEHRADIYKVITDLGEGETFTIADICGDRPELRRDFLAMQGFDHVPVGAGRHVAIWETPHLRRLPAARKVAAIWARRNKMSIVPSPDWTALHVGIAPHQPIGGLHYLTDTGQQALFMRSVAIRFEEAPEWLRREDDAGTMLRALHSVAPKDFNDTLDRFIKAHRDGVDRIQAAADLAAEIFIENETFEPGDLDRLAEIFDLQQAWLERKKR
jgi:hypothetical protein